MINVQALLSFLRARFTNTDAMGDGPDARVLKQRLSGRHRSASTQNRGKRKLYRVDDVVAIRSRLATSIFANVTLIVILIVSSIGALYAMSYYRLELSKAQQAATERARSLRIADQALQQLVEDGEQCSAETLAVENKLRETSGALMACVQATTKHVYMEQVKRNCTIANNRLVRLAKAGI